MLKKTLLSEWDRSLQRSFYSMLVFLPWSLYEHPLEPFHGWTALAAHIAALGALGGILVPMVIKHADGLARNQSAAASIVLTSAASHYLSDTPMNAPIIIGSMVVIVSAYNYQLDAR